MIYRGIICGCEPGVGAVVRESPIAEPGPQIFLSLAFDLQKNTTSNPRFHPLNEMSDRASTVPDTPQSLNAAELQDGFEHLIMHNTSNQQYSNQFQGGNTQMSPDGSSALGLDTPLYSDDVYGYGENSTLLPYGQPQNNGLDMGYVS